MISYSNEHQCSSAFLSNSPLSYFTRRRGSKDVSIFADQSIWKMQPKKNSFDTSENIPMKMASDFDFDFVKSSLSHFWGPSSDWECFHIEVSGPPKLDALLSGSCIPESDKVKFWFQTVTKLYSLYIHMSDQNPNWNS